MPFTARELVVLLLVIAVGGTYFGLARVQGHRKSLRIQCMSNMKQIGGLVISYADDHGDRFPSDPSSTPTSWGTFQQLVDATSLFDPRVLTSPAHRDAPGKYNENGQLVLRENNVSYAVLARGGTTEAHPSTVLASNDTYRGAPNQTGEPEGHRGGVTILYVTGEARFLPVEELGEGRSFPEGLVDGSGRTQ